MNGTWVNPVTSLTMRANLSLQTSRSVPERSRRLRPRQPRGVAERNSFIGPHLRSKRTGAWMLISYRLPPAPAREAIAPKACGYAL